MNSLHFRFLYAGVLILVNVLALFLSQLSLPISLITGILSIIIIVFLENFIKPYFEKGENEISPKRVKKKLFKILKNYEVIKDNVAKEREEIIELGKFFLNLEKLGFSREGQHTFKTLDFEIHVTGNLPNITQFLIRKVENGRPQDINVTYFSKAYNKVGQINILYDFINYLKHL